MMMMMPALVVVMPAMMVMAEVVMVVMPPDAMQVPVPPMTVMQRMVVRFPCQLRRLNRKRPRRRA